jgi:hypothetical protein
MSWKLGSSLTRSLPRTAEARRSTPWRATVVPTHHGVVFLEVSSLGGRIVNSDGGPPEQAKPICYFKPGGA